MLIVKGLSQIEILKKVSQERKLNSIPVLIFTANEQYEDPEVWFDMQTEIKELSTEGKHLFIKANHGSIITKKKNAEIINKKILSMSETLK